MSLPNPKHCWINNEPQLTEIERMRIKQYVDYYRRLRNIKGIGAAFSFVLSASSNFPHEVWRREDGHISEIVQLVGNRNF